MCPPDLSLARHLPHSDACDSYNLLAVDDMPDNLFLLDVILGEEERYHIDFASSGEEALEMVAASPPDLILLDIMMPGITGYEVARRIRQNPQISYIPILFVTANDEIDAAKSFAAKADGLIHKPFDVDELMEQVQTLLLDNKQENEA